MAVEFRLDTLGGHAVEAKLKSIVEAFDQDSAHDLMEYVGGVLESQTQDRFEKGVAPDGSRWEPSLRVRQGRGSKTLNNTGILSSTITSQASASSVAVGTNMGYGAIHQFGGTIRAKTSKGLRFQLPGKLGWRNLMEVTLPARPFLGLSDDDARDIDDAVEEFLADRMGGMD